MDYALFLLLTATLFIRPAELVPAVQGWPIYEWLIIASLVVSAPRIARNLQIRNLRTNPITVCVLGMLAAVPLSFLSQLSLWHMRWSLLDFGKVVLFYVLVTAVVDSHERLRRLLFSLLLFVTVLAGLSLLHYFDVWHLPALKASMQQRVVDHATGRSFELDRLQSTGIFADPNDFAMILVLGIVFCLHFLGEQRGLIRRGPLMAVMLLLGYALFLTRSRGGMLALLGALGTLAYARWGWKKAALGVAATMPMVLIVFRMREDAMTSGTGQSRVQLWSEGLGLFKQSPLWGIGYGQYAEEVGHVAHNSFLHCFTELGLLGGACFFGAFFSAVVLLYDLRKTAAREDWIDSQRLLATALGCIVGFGLSCLSLTRSYIVPTYLILGIAVASIRVEADELDACDLPLPRFGVNPRSMLQTGAASVAFMAATYMFVRLTVQWS